MHIQYEPLSGHNPFLDRYIEEDPALMTFYDYSYQVTDLQERAKELKARNFQRAKLKSVLKTYNESLTSNQATFEQIDKLGDDRSLMIVGGQQAGLFTGPMYTINKVISILAHAKETEENLGVPVVPLFWIAGEDHDIDEINHAFIHYKGELKRVAMRERNDLKIPASKRSLDQSQVMKQLKESLLYLRETVHTKDLYEEWEQLIFSSTTYVEFFAKLIHRLFEGTGLVLMDAADEQIRKLERPFFKDLIEENESVRDAFTEQAKAFQEAGNGSPVQVDMNLSHLFIHDNDERILLYFDEEREAFVDKEGHRSWTKNELLKVAEEEPERLSNNVISRPLMQEWLLPVLGFISGPGEIRYWGTLKKLFHFFNFQIPPLLPRMQFSIVERGAEKYLKALDLNLWQVASAGVEESREEWYEKNKPIDYDPIFETAEAEMRKVMEKVAEGLNSTDATKMDYERFTERSLQGLEQYKRTVGKQVDHLLRPTLNHFDHVRTVLHPNGGLQERTVNVLPFLNEYGSDLIQRLSVEIINRGSKHHYHTFVFL
ncbi:bacillithiol biosynthesis cysteine-adding enzyme BshC [Alteribacter populi]|uniref:bacillithiol biosynthesis cysteine-adding enzyme BshC n=1 Tax=Alteribacter populi TaxID=2011011 RepID=UPI0012FDB341|nr:bacillithiol biosynthesis cysteine-adding enzyme BshC [Alteribacter populi]